MFWGFAAAGMRRRHAPQANFRAAGNLMRCRTRLSIHFLTDLYYPFFLEWINYFDEMYFRYIYIECI